MSNTVTMGSYGGGSDQWDDDETGGRPCANGKHCAEADYAGNPQLGPRAFCYTDHRHIGQVIRGLPAAYVELSFKLAKAGQPEERVSGSRDAPVPVDLEVQAFMRHVVLVALAWEENVRAAADLTDPHQCPACRGDADWCQACGGSGIAASRDGAALGRACNLLAGTGYDRDGHLNTLLALPPTDVVRPVKLSTALAELEPGSVVRIDTSGDAWQRKPMDGAAAGTEFLKLAGRARGILGLTLQRQRVPVRCDGRDCGALTLVQREALSGDWEPVIRCTNCPRVYIGADYEDLMARWWKLAEAAKAS